MAAYLENGMATHSTIPRLPWWLKCKESAYSAGDLGSILGWEDPLEKEMATPSSILAWRIPWKQEPGKLYPMGSQRVRHNFHFSFTLPTSFIFISMGCRICLNLMFWKHVLQNCWGPRRLTLTPEFSSSPKANVVAPVSAHKQLQFFSYLK